MTVTITYRSPESQDESQDGTYYNMETLLENGSTRRVVLTTGKWVDAITRDVEEIDTDVYYETKAYEAKFEGGIYVADKTKPVALSCQTTIDCMCSVSDQAAGQMHDDAVCEIACAIA